MVNQRGALDTNPMLFGTFNTRRLHPTQPPLVTAPAISEVKRLHRRAATDPVQLQQRPAANPATGAAAFFPPASISSFHNFVAEGGNKPLLPRLGSDVGAADSDESRSSRFSGAQGVPRLPPPTENDPRPAPLVRERSRTWGPDSEAASAVRVWKPGGMLKMGDRDAFMKNRRSRDVGLAVARLLLVQETFALCLGDFLGASVAIFCSFVFAMRPPSP
ncbi:hypothetical protein BDK51DRAFT_51490 [Blyttiomyces helicus]|uniref:Uncharacterized protein n=1 Tax=Blyttiomyces helicus TaxID=388810 RepID=A0A4P9W6N6_9FUNG|nr:hypothetical protein BDK51DRAFT_51490 [Blyttiomyces helicus]|eukprot:RKO88129.1 hypothetical protein BDK51DRAFT_51490 [Blyttiomyces helicus]